MKEVFFEIIKLILLMISSAIILTSMLGLAVERRIDRSGDDIVCNAKA